MKSEPLQPQRDDQDAERGKQAHDMTQSQPHSQLDSHDPHLATHFDILALQRTHGNRFVQRYVAQRQTTASPNVRRQVINEDLTVIGKVHATNGMSASQSFDLSGGQLNAPVIRADNVLASGGYISAPTGPVYATDFIRQQAVPQTPTGQQSGTAQPSRDENAD